MESEKKHIDEFMRELTEEQLMGAMQAYDDWKNNRDKSTRGVLVLNQEKPNRSAIDEIYVNYMAPLEGEGISSWIHSYYHITNEIAVRVFTNFEKSRNLLYTIYSAGFSHGSNEGLFLEHGTFEAFQRLLKGESPTLDSEKYDIAEKVKKHFINVYEK